MRDPGANFEFDVAVSFAGEDRQLVEQITAGLKASGVRVFYDHDQQSSMWGEDLVEYFDRIYRLKSRYALLFVSQRYAQKMWTRHERRSALARGLDQEAAYVLPVRLDDSDLPGLRPTVGYLDVRQVGPGGVIRAVLAKLGVQPPVTQPAVVRVPRDAREEEQLLLVRPRGWEYLYFAARLLAGRSQLERKYLDHETGYASRTGEVVGIDGMSAYLRRATDDAQDLFSALMRLMEPSVRHRAFGQANAAGDPGRIHHLADRWTAAYEGLLDWSARLRGTSVPGEYRQAVRLLAAMNEEPIAQYRTFVDQIVKNCDEIPAAQAAGRPLEIILTLTLSISDSVAKEYGRELKRIRRRR